jgi:hypothetical protein
MNILWLRALGSFVLRGVCGLATRLFDRLVADSFQEKYSTSSGNVVGRRSTFQ